MWSKIGQSKYLRQTSIVRSKPSLMFIFEIIPEKYIIIHNYRTYQKSYLIYCWFILYIEALNSNKTHFIHIQEVKSCRRVTTDFTRKFILVRIFVKRNNIVSFLLRSKLIVGIFVKRTTGLE